MERKAILKESLVLMARAAIKKALDDEDINTAKWLLERKKKQEFTTNMEVATEDDETMKIHNKIEIVCVAPDGSKKALEHVPEK